MRRREGIASLGAALCCSPKVMAQATARVYRVGLLSTLAPISNESEQVLDGGESSDSFFYTWSEPTLAPVEWLRFGLAVQQTYAHETDSGSQGGPLVGFSYKNVDVSAYVFDVSQDRPTFVIAAGLRF